MTDKKENRIPLKEELLDENEKLKRKIEELQAKLKENTGEEKVTESELRPDDYISVVSLCPFTLSLSTEGFGRGKNFTFRNFGDKKKILYSDLILIIENQTGFLEAGYFYILDGRVIRQHGYDELYETILNKDQFEELFSNKHDVEYCMEIYESANPRQRKIIERMIVGILAKDGDINRNLASAISSSSKNDLFQMAKSLKDNGLADL